MTEDNKTIAHKLTRTLYTHSELFSIAEAALARGKEARDPGEFLTALVLAAFSFEAYLNFAGEALCPYWAEVARMPVRNKFRMVCKIAGFEPDLTKKPYSSLDQLWKFRNDMAHAKTENLTEIRNGPARHPLNYPKAKWEKQCTAGTASRLLDDTKDVMRDLHKRSGLRSGVIGLLGEQGGSVLQKRPRR